MKKRCGASYLVDVYTSRLILYAVYPLVIKLSYPTWPFIVNFPIKMVIFHSYVNIYLRESTMTKHMLAIDSQVTPHCFSHAHGACKAHRCRLKNPVETNDMGLSFILGSLPNWESQHDSLTDSSLFNWSLSLTRVDYIYIYITNIHGPQTEE